MRSWFLLALACPADGILSPARPAVTRSAAVRRTATTTTLPLRIDGTWYDLADWADEHPGGA